MPRTHVEQLFSAAYDDELSEHEADRFQEHIRGCQSCASAYEEFRISVEAVRALPEARMPVAVHLPSTAPVAEQRVFASLRLPRLRFGSGGATAIAAAAAAVIVAVALLRPGGTTTTSRPNQNFAGSAANDQGGRCPTPLQARSATGAPPAGYDYRSNASDPRRPGQQLVLASTTSEATAGSVLIVYAQLTVPLAAAAAPGAGGASSTAGAAAVVPCLTLSGLSSGSFSPLALSTSGAAQAVPTTSGVAGEAVPAPYAAPSPLFTFTIPPGTPPGTVLFVVATIPPGYPNAGDPPLTVNLQITVR